MSARMWLTRIILGVAAVALVAYFALESHARSEYDFHCRATYTHLPINVSGCDHGSREWHSP